MRRTEAGADDGVGAYAFCIMKLAASVSALFRTTYPHGKYRPDIDGLRALAVLAVIAYHYFPTRLPGGFIGVDIFFVLSGYLITGILAHSFEGHPFGYTLWHFYQHRIRRIFPAVAIMLTLLLIAGWLLLFPDEYEALAKHVVAGAGFAENLLLWHEAGYFDASAIQKPLLHFWSLAVEEQFYIFWPFVLWFAIRRKWPLLNTIAVIIVISMVLNVWTVWKGDTTSAFYLPMMRTWELMAGAWLAIAHREGTLPDLPQWAVSQLAWLGLLLIIVGFAVIRPTGPFPGFLAILPVLGCALIVHAGPQSVLNRVFLSWRPAVWIGLISYPLYLWHWALWSMMNKVLGPAEPMVTRNRKIGLIILSILLAWMTYQWVEKPIRARGKVAAVFALLVLMATIGVCGIAVYELNGITVRPGTLVPINAASTYLKSIRFPSQEPKCHRSWLHGSKDWQTHWYCTLGDTSSSHWIAGIGDSHEMHLIPAINKYAKSHGLRFISGSGNLCNVFFGVTAIYPYDIANDAELCSIIRSGMYRMAMHDKPELIIIGGLWSQHVGFTRYPDDTIEKGGVSAFEYGLIQTAKRYEAIGVKLLIIKDTPPQPNGIPLSVLRQLPSVVLRSTEQTDRILNVHATTPQQNAKYQAVANRAIDRVSKMFPNTVYTVDASQGLCRETHCLVAADGRFLYKDNTHLSPAGARFDYGVIASGINNALNGRH